MSITVAKLHKMLGALINQGHGRKKVCIDKKTLYHPLEGDGVTLHDIEKIETEWVYTVADDGGIKTRKDGSECGSTVVILKGSDA